MKRFVRTSAVALSATVAFLLVLPTRAAADTIRLSQGFIALDMEGQLVFAFGSPDFNVRQVPIAAIEWAGIGLNMGCALGGGCAPGQLLDFDNDTSGTVSFGRGNAFFDGTQHRDLEFTGDWHFTSPGARVPTSGERFLFVSAPFRFTGTLSGRRSDGTQIFSVDLTGFGLASEPLQQVGDFPIYITEEARSLVYQFTGGETVPEPASLLLVATGGACVLSRRRLNRAGPSR